MISPDAIPVYQPVDSRRYWRAVVFFVLLLGVAVIVVALRGSHAGLRARSTFPADGAQVSVRPLIRVTFARTVDRATVENAVTIAPEVPFLLSWGERELRILPTSALLPQTEYTVTIGPGVRDSFGTPLEGTLAWRFTTRQPRLLYTRPGEQGNNELWVSDALGQEQRRLSLPGQHVRDFEPSPDGSTVLFVVEESSEATYLWRVDPERQGLNQVTRESGSVYGSPRFSPSGDLVALEVRRVTQVGDQGAVLSPPQIELRRPTDGSPAGVVYGEGEQEIGYAPRWSPDGTRLAFIEANQGAIGIFNFTRDILFYTASDPILGLQPWDPTGTLLTYSQIVQETQGAFQVLAVRDVDLGTPSIYRDTEGGNQADPAWSPDGSAIVYTSQPIGPTGNNVLWLMRADGSAHVKLVSEPNVIYTNPLWSPDGQAILFGRFDPLSGQQAIWTVRPDGSDPRPVVPVGFQANWLP